MEAVFAANAEQEDIARSRGVTAPIITGARFYLAEDYHQKYYLRHDSVLMRELADYPQRDFVDSTVAARLNGYVARRGSLDQLKGEIESFGLSAQATEYLLRRCA